MTKIYFDTNQYMFTINYNCNGTYGSIRVKKEILNEMYFFRELLELVEDEITTLSIKLDIEEDAFLAIISDYVYRNVELVNPIALTTARLFLTGNYSEHDIGNILDNIDKYPENTIELLLNLNIKEIDKLCADYCWNKIPKEYREARFKDHINYFGKYIKYIKHEWNFSSNGYKNDEDVKHITNYNHAYERYHNLSRDDLRIWYRRYFTDFLMFHKVDNKLVLHRKMEQLFDAITTDNPVVLKVTEHFNFPNSISAVHKNKENTSTTTKKSAYLFVKCDSDNNSIIEGINYFCCIKTSKQYDEPPTSGVTLKYFNGIICFKKLSKLFYKEIEMLLAFNSPDLPSKYSDICYAVIQYAYDGTSPPDSDFNYRSYHTEYSEYEVIDIKKKND